MHLRIHGFKYKFFRVGSTDLNTYSAFSLGAKTFITKVMLSPEFANPTIRIIESFFETAVCCLICPVLYQKSLSLFTCSIFLRTRLFLASSLIRSSIYPKAKFLNLFDSQTVSEGYIVIVIFEADWVSLSDFSRFIVIFFYSVLILIFNLPLSID